MRVQLISAVLLAARAARAEPEGEHATVVVRESAYVDDDHTTISTTAVAVRTRPTASLIVSARYIADAVSSASVDVVTAATGRWSELRSEVLTGVAYADGTTTVSLDYVYSHENDGDSHTASLGGSRDLLRHNLTLAAGASYVDNRIGRANDLNFDERMHTLGGSARAVWTATPEDIVTTSYDLSRSSGYQASPYRYALVAEMSGVPIAFAEEVPA